MVRSGLQARHFPHSYRTSKSVTACVNKNLSHFAAAASSDHTCANPVNINVTDALPQCSVTVQNGFFLVYKKNKDGGRVKLHVSYAQCKGRRAFVVLPRLGQPAFLV